MRLVAAPDTFRGTLSAVDAALAIADAAAVVGWRCTQVPLADGGEGTLAALGGANRTSTVTGPLGAPVQAAWRLDGTRAVVETALASGLLLAGGRAGNDPVAATTRGTGELVREAVQLGALEVVVGVGGSATTDGGQGAVEALAGLDLTGVRLVVACDVRTRFEDSARDFAPQKGADPEQVRLLTRRLGDQRREYASRFGVDVGGLAGSGAAGGLAGGLAALGAELRPGLELVAARCGLEQAVRGADLVVTGEGCLDAQSFEGKVVGGVLALADRYGVPVLAVVGDVAPPAGERVEHVSLVATYGERSWTDPAACVREAVAEVLGAWGAGVRPAGNPVGADGGLP